MKKLNLLLILATAGTASSLAADCCTTTKKSCDSCSCEATSKTFFSVRPLYTSQKAELIAGFRNERAHVRENGIGGALDVVFFGSKSTNDKRLASYFMPDCATKLTAGSNASQEATLDSRHFNVFTANDTEDQFESSLCFSMNQSVMGIGLHYKQLFYWNDQETEGWWLSISAPITRVKNTVNMSEKITDPVIAAPTGGVTSMTQAFNQSAWCYGKIACECPEAKIGLADIEVKIGGEILPCPEAHFAFYGGLVIPTGNKAKAAYVFEPIVGNGGHLGLATGMEGGYILWKNDDKNQWFSAEFSTHSQYLFKNTQTRSFDVKNKPWSRYQAMYANEAQAQKAITDGDIYLQTPGINMLTSDVNVTPRLSHNINSSAIFNASGFRIEVGYNLFCRQSECVKLDCTWATGNDAPAFKKQLSLDEIQAGDPVVLDPTRPIGFLQEEGISDVGFIVDDYSLASIKEADLNMQSATHPAILTNTFHLALGYRWDKLNFPIHLDGGASYEFAQENNTVLDRWAVWAKAGFAF
jgi:hypothetical protein